MLRPSHALAVSFLLAITLLPACASDAGATVVRSGKSSVAVRDWGLVAGRPVKLFTLTNARGAVCRITNYGATVTELLVPDRRGLLADVVLGFDDVDAYVKGSPYFGCIAGRVANRIAKGKFTLDGQEHTLATNNGPNHLHGGVKGFDKVVWNVVSQDVEQGPSVTLGYRSKDGEEGYPGNLEVTVTYAWTDDNELKVAMHATTDRTTIVNLAHHTYWNLAGHDSGTILDHELALACERYTPVDNTLIPTGEIAPVAGTPFDFRTAKKIGVDIATLKAQPDAGHGGGYDLNYVVDGDAAKLRLVATVFEPRSGRVLELLGDQPGVQFYSGNFLDGTLKGKGGAVYAQHQGFCLETQKFPDSIHQPSFPSVVLKPGETYRHVMVHRFATR